MTIFGAVAARECAIVWADTLVTVKGKPGEQQCKLAVNALAGVVAVATGRLELLRDGFHAVAEHDCLETIAAAVATSLRASAMRMVTRRGERAPGWFACNLFVVAGWSAAEQRMLVYTLDAADMFEPRPASTALCPEVPITFNGSPLSRQEVADIASRQAALHRAAGGDVGRLSVATITPHGIVAHAPTDMPASDQTAPVAEAA